MTLSIMAFSTTIKNAALCIITLSMMVRDGVMLSVTNKLLLNAVMLSVVRLNVVSP
jgi:hypothetical protein